MRGLDRGQMPVEYLIVLTAGVSPFLSSLCLDVLFTCAVFTPICSPFPYKSFVGLITARWGSTSWKKVHLFIRSQRFEDLWEAEG